MEVAHVHVKTCCAVFRYEFDQTLPFLLMQNLVLNERASCVRHRIVFRALSSKALPWRAEDRAVSELIATYWTNFAKTGDPNGPEFTNGLHMGRTDIRFCISRLSHKRLPKTIASDMNSLMDWRAGE